VTGGRKAVVGWVLYDWANSAFALTVMAAFFPVFFRNYWCSGIDPALSTARLGFGTAAAGLAMALVAPVLGALADAGGNRKRFLLWFMAAGCAATAGLAAVGQGAWLGALGVFVVANIGFSGANLFYDSLLPAVAPAERMDLVSSVGYAVGYLGCALLFILNIVMVRQPAVFGLSGPSAGIRAAFISVALWWSLFSLPLFLFVKEPRDAATRTAGMFGRSMRQLGQTVRHIAGDRRVLLFLFAYWLYIDGVHTFIRMAADFGMSIGLKPEALMVSLLVVQLVAFPSAISFGFVSRRIGAGPSLLAGIAIYIFVTVIGSLTLTTQAQYTVFAVLSAIPLGCLQALSRSHFARMIPADRSAEYFGFYDLTGKFAVIFGPAVVGLVTLAARRTGISASMSTRLGFSSTALLFVCGGMLLLLSERADRDTNAGC